jgi:hypothetical protein
LFTSVLYLYPLFSASCSLHTPYRISGFAKRRQGAQPKLKGGLESVASPWDSPLHCSGWVRLDIWAGSFSILCTTHQWPVAQAAIAMGGWAEHP